MTPPTRPLREEEPRRQFGVCDYRQRLHLRTARCLNFVEEPMTASRHHYWCAYRLPIPEGGIAQPCDCWMDDSEPEPRPDAPIVEGGPSPRLCAAPKTGHMLKHLGHYLQDELAVGRIDFHIRARVDRRVSHEVGGDREWEVIRFYIHPQGADGDTQDYFIDANANPALLFVDELDKPWPDAPALTPPIAAAPQGIAGDVTTAEAAIEQSRAICDLKDDWDGEGSVGYSVETWERATTYLRNLGRVPVPLISPAEFGSIDLYWCTEGRTLLINVPANTGDATFAGSGGSISGYATDATLTDLAAWLTGGGWRVAPSLACETEPKEPCGDCNKLRAKECAANGCVVQQLGGERAPDGETTPLRASACCPQCGGRAFAPLGKDHAGDVHHCERCGLRVRLVSGEVYVYVAGDASPRDVSYPLYASLKEKYDELRASLSTAEQALLTAHEDRAKAEGERESLRSAVQAIVTRAEHTGLAHGPLDAIRALLRHPDGGGMT